VTFTRLRRLSLSYAALLGLGILLATPVAVGAQAVVRFGSASATMVMPVHLSIPTRLSVTAAGDERIVERTSGYTEIDLPVRVAANLAWTLRVSLPEPREGDTVLVRTAEGDWSALGATDIAVRRGDQATEPHEVLVRLRLPVGVATAASLGLRLSLSPTLGAP
jgi:hypothetical protein